MSYIQQFPAGFSLSANHAIDERFTVADITAAPVLWLVTSYVGLITYDAATGNHYKVTATDGTQAGLTVVPMASGSANFVEEADTTIEPTTRDVNSNVVFSDIAGEPLSEALLALAFPPTTPKQNSGTLEFGQDFPEEGGPVRLEYGVATNVNLAFTGTAGDRASFPTVGTVFINDVDSGTVNGNFEFTVTMPTTIRFEVTLPAQTTMPKDNYGEDAPTARVAEEVVVRTFTLFPEVYSMFALNPDETNDPFVNTTTAENTTWAKTLSNITYGWRQGTIEDVTVEPGTALYFIIPFPQGIERLECHVGGMVLELAEMAVSTFVDFGTETDDAVSSVFKIVGQEDDFVIDKIVPVYPQRI